MTHFITMFFKVAWPLIKWLSNGNNRWCKTTFYGNNAAPFPLFVFYRYGFLIGTKRGSFYASNSAAAVAVKKGAGVRVRRIIPK